MRLCGFPGDGRVAWDELPKNKRVCKHAGFRYCVFSGKFLTINEEGWRECWGKCKQPFYEEET